MSEHQPLNPELEEFERHLKSLVPQTPHIDHAELMFRAGRESAQRESRRTLRSWQFATLATSLCALLSVSLSGGESETAPVSVTAQNPPAVSTERNSDQQTPAPEAGRSTHVAKNQDSPSPPKAPTPSATAMETASAPVLPNRWWGSLFYVSTPSPETYPGLRNRVLEEGTSALPPSTGGGNATSADSPLTASPRSARKWFENDPSSQI